jgi:hypothetical protein
LAVYRYLLRLNEEVSSIKFGLDHDGQLSLMIEWPLDGLTFACFEKAIRTLLASHETYYPDIQLVAQNVGLAQHVAARELQEREQAQKDREATPIEVAPDQPQAPGTESAEKGDQPNGRAES